MILASDRTAGEPWTTIRACVLRNRRVISWFSPDIWPARRDLLLRRSCRALGIKRLALQSFDLRPATLRCLALGRQYTAHCLDEAEPPRRGRDQLRSARARQPVVLCPAAIRGRFPLGRDPLSLKQPLQRRIQGAVVNIKLIVGLLLQETRNSICVVRPRLQAAEYQQFQRALQKLKPLPWIVYPWTI